MMTRTVRESSMTNARMFPPATIRKFQVPEVPSSKFKTRRPLPLLSSTWNLELS